VPPGSRLGRVFLDANVLYSAAYLERSGLGRLWSLKDVELISSAYAIEEARRNLAIDRPEALQRLVQLTTTLSIVDAPRALTMPKNVRLDPKDHPILLAAIHSHAGYLLTGDVRHFNHLFGKRISGVLILRPAEYLTHHDKS
jgi:predicted nucleic acid-binding protein